MENIEKYKREVMREYGNIMKTIREIKENLRELETDVWHLYTTKLKEMV